jgi:hypothetical protein
MKPETKKRIKPWLIAGMGAVLIGFWVYAAFSPPPGSTVSYLDAAGNLREQLKKEAAKPGNRISRFVDHAHRTVTVKEVSVEKCQAVTNDGSDAIAAGFGNLVRFEVEYRVTWNGWFHKDGETIVGCSFEPQQGDLRSTPLKVLRTTAKYTRDECL